MKATKRTGDARGRIHRNAAALPARCATAGVLLAAAGCGGAAVGSGGGGTKPPPPAITLSAIGPDHATLAGANWVVAGMPEFTLLASGAGFTSTSVIRWNGAALPTRYGSSTNLAATVSAALVVAPGAAAVTVCNAASGAASNSLSFGIASPAAATAGVVELISLSPDGAPANDDSLVAPSISTTGRFIAFQSAATNLAPGPPSGYQEIYERDTCIGAPAGCTPRTIRITVTAGGSAVDGNSKDSAISADGRYVAFDSSAGNILPDTASCASPYACVYLRDTCTGAPAGCTPSTKLVPVGGLAGITPSGRYLLIEGGTENLHLVIPGGPFPAAEYVVEDTCNEAPSSCKPGAVLISQSTAGDPANENPTGATVSSTGRYAAFGDWASNLGQQNENGWPGVFLRDDCIGAPSGCTPGTTKIDNAPDGSVADGPGGEAGNSAVSADGRFVAFDSTAMNLVVPNLSPCPGNGSPPLSCGFTFLRDTCNGAPDGCRPSTSIASLGNSGSLPNASAADQESISADGRFVAFASLANNLVPGDTFPVNGWKDIFVRDTCFGAPAGCHPSTVRVSVANYAGHFAAQSNAINDYPRISGDGHFIVFLSAATNFLPSGGNGHTLVYLALTGF
jgi:trimeric autotransporter adhesin